MPKAFSTNSMIFDREPEDRDLVWLLGDPSFVGRVAVEETPERLVALPASVPMRAVLCGLGVVGILLTALPWVLRDSPDQTISPSIWVSVGCFWVLLAPAAVAMCWMRNHNMAQHGELCRVDKREGRLDLPGAGRSFTGARVRALVDLGRYHARYHGFRGAALWIQQVGVLVETEGGLIEHIPLAHIESNWTRDIRLADRLADTFGVPVRRIRLSMVESRRLRDAWEFPLGP